MNPCQSVLGPSGCITATDGNTAEGVDPTLACCDTKFHVTHTNTDEAIANLLHCATPGDDLHLVGHGIEGSIFTGVTSISANNQHIDVANESYWAPLLDDLAAVKPGSLRLWSCYTGSIYPPTLLTAMASRLGARVWAFTGAIQCNLSSQGLGNTQGSWVYADPGGPGPSPPDLDWDDLLGITTEVFIVTRERSLTLPVDSVKSATYIDALAPDRAPRLLKGAEAQRLTQWIAFQRPLPQGLPLTIPTGRLILRFASGLKHPFIILGDRLLRDEENPRNYYPTRPLFSEYLKILRKL